MYLIKVRFLKDGIASGRDYTYWCPEEVAVCDYIQINENMRGQVTQIDVPESEIESYKDKVKTVIGKTQKFIFTFGEGQEYMGHFVVVWANNDTIARADMISAYGNKWAFQYTEDEWKAWEHGKAAALGLEVETEIKFEKKVEEKQCRDQLNIWIEAIEIIKRSTVRFLDLIR